MVIVTSDIVSRMLSTLGTCIHLVKYRTSEWSIPAILSSVVWAIGPTSVVATFAPFMAGNLVQMTRSKYEGQYADDNSVQVCTRAIARDQATFS
jgi:hypothetical protein